MIPLSCVGIVLGFLAPLYLRFLRFAERLFSNIDIPVPLKLAISGAVVGVLAILNPAVPVSYAVNVMVGGSLTSSA